MQFLSGVAASSAIIYAASAVSVLFVYYLYGRDAEYLYFGLFSLSLAGLSAAESAFFLAGSLEGTVVPNLLMFAAFPVVSISLLEFTLFRSGARPGAGRWKWPRRAVHGIGLACIALSLSGWILDYGHPLHREYAVGAVQVRMSEYAISGVGLFVIAFSISVLFAANLLLVRTYRKDRAIGVFIAGTMVVMVALAANDTLSALGVIDSLYLAREGFLLLLIGIMVGFLREFERSRQELRARTAALEAADRSIARMSEDLSESSIRLGRATEETHRLKPMADLGRLSASLAHEIRNPLAVISNVVSTLRRHDRPDSPPGGNGAQFSSLVEMLQEETDRLARLVDDLLVFSQSGRVSRGQVHVADVVAMAIADVRASRSPGEEGCEIEQALDPGILPVVASAEGLRRALVNLLVNSVQSSGGSGTIRILARPEPGARRSVMVGVEDHAGGIPEKVLPEIFEPFFSTRPQGTGLGLSIVKSIVEAHGGDLLVENRPGDGVTIWMCLPAIVATDPPR